MAPADPQVPDPAGLARFRIDRTRAALLVIDFQDRLAAAMPEAERIACERNISILVELGRRQSWPVVVTRQYPQGLGDVVPALATALQGTGLALRQFDKVHFSCTEAPPFEEVFRAAGRDQWVVTGVETHVCVFQTVRGLLTRGVSVHVPVDAVTSRRPANRDRGLRLMEAMGAVLTTTETVVFDALGMAGGDDFKALARLIR